MDATTGFFYLFSAVMLFAAFRVITARNPVHAVLFLILAFSQASGLWLLLKAEFLAIVLVLVYLGAVMVLFLFVVMMLDVHFETIRKGFWRHFPLALVVGALVALEIGAVMFAGFGHGPAQAMPELSAPGVGQVAQYSNTKELGVLLYTQYLYPVEIAAVILLIAMVAAIALTLRERRDDNKAIDASEQVHVRAQDRIQIIKLSSTQPAPKPQTAQDEDPEEVKS